MNESKTSAGDYVLVVMLEPQELGQRFDRWPLHMTLLPWFEAPSADDVVELCRKAVSDFSVFQVKVAGREHFGLNKKLPVTLVEPHPEVMQLHNTLLELVKANGWNMQGRYTGSLYRPHVTQKRGKDASGSIVINEIYIVEKQEQGYRKVAGKVPLSG